VPPLLLALLLLGKLLLAAVAPLAVAVLVVAAVAAGVVVAVEVMTPAHAVDVKYATNSALILSPGSVDINGPKCCICIYDVKQYSSSVCTRDASQCMLH
jgi:hypothetical protein